MNRILILKIGASLSALAASAGGNAQDVAIESEGQARTTPNVTADTATAPSSNMPKVKEGFPAEKSPTKPKPRPLGLPIEANAYYDAAGLTIKDQVTPHTLQLIEVPLKRLPVDLDQKSDDLWVKAYRRPNKGLLALVNYAARDEAEVTLGDGSKMRVYRAERNAKLPASKKAPEGLILQSTIYCGALDQEQIFKRVVCFHDIDEDNTFERVAAGQSDEIDRHPVGAAVMLPSALLKAPLTYRPVTPDQRTSFTFEMRNCADSWNRPSYFFQRKEGDLGEEQFLRKALGSDQFDSLNAERKENLLDLMRKRILQRRRGSVPCRRGSRIDSFDTITEQSLGKKHILADIDGLIFSIGPKGDVAPVKLLGAREIEEHSRVEIGVLEKAQSGLSTAQKAIATAQKFDRSPYMSTGEMTASKGTQELGYVLLDVPFNYGYMGELVETSGVRGLLGRGSVKGGTIMYGVPMKPVVVTDRYSSYEYGDKRSVTTRLTWCMPDSKTSNIMDRSNRANTKIGTKTKWFATCINPIGDKYTVLKDQQPAFAVDGISTDISVRKKDGTPEVAMLEQSSFEEQSRMRYYMGADKEGSLQLMRQLWVGDMSTHEAVVHTFDPKSLGKEPGSSSQFEFPVAGGTAVFEVTRNAAGTSKEKGPWKFTTTITKPAKKDSKVAMSVPSYEWSKVRP